VTKATAARDNFFQSLIDFVVLRPTRHKTGHFGDVLLNQSLEKLKQTQQKHMHL